MLDEEKEIIHTFVCIGLYEDLYNRYVISDPGESYKCFSMINNFFNFLRLYPQSLIIETYEKINKKEIDLENEIVNTEDFYNSNLLPGYINQLKCHIDKTKTV